MTKVSLIIFLLFVNSFCLCSLNKRGIRDPLLNSEDNADGGSYYEYDFENSLDEFFKSNKLTQSSINENNKQLFIKDSAMQSSVNENNKESFIKDSAVQSSVNENNNPSFTKYSAESSHEQKYNNKGKNIIDKADSFSYKRIPQFVSDDFDEGPSRVIYPINSQSPNLYHPEIGEQPPDDIANPQDYLASKIAKHSVIKTDESLGFEINDKEALEKKVLGRSPSEETLPLSPDEEANRQNKYFSRDFDSEQAADVGSGDSNNGFQMDLPANIDSTNKQSLVELGAKSGHYGEGQESIYYSPETSFIEPQDSGALSYSSDLESSNEITEYPENSLPSNLDAMPMSGASFLALKSIRDHPRRFEEPKNLPLKDPEEVLAASHKARKKLRSKSRLSKSWHPSSGIPQAPQTAPVQPVPATDSSWFDVDKDLPQYKPNMRDSTSKKLSAQFLNLMFSGQCTGFLQLWRVNPNLDASSALVVVENLNAEVAVIAPPARNRDGSSAVLSFNSISVACLSSLLRYSQMSAHNMPRVVSVSFTGDWDNEWLLKADSQVLEPTISVLHQYVHVVPVQVLKLKLHIGRIINLENKRDVVARICSFVEHAVDIANSALSLRTLSIDIDIEDEQLGISVSEIIGDYIAFNPRIEALNVSFFVHHLQTLEVLLEYVSKSASIRSLQWNFDASTRSYRHSANHVPVPIAQALARSLFDNSNVRISNFTLNYNLKSTRPLLHQLQIFVGLLCYPSIKHFTVNNLIIEPQVTKMLLHCLKTRQELFQDTAAFTLSFGTLGLSDAYENDLLDFVHAMAETHVSSSVSYLESFKLGIELAYFPSDPARYISTLEKLHYNLASFTKVAKRLNAFELDFDAATAQILRWSLNVPVLALRPPIVTAIGALIYALPATLKQLTIRGFVLSKYTAAALRDVYTLRYDISSHQDRADSLNLDVILPTFEIYQLFTKELPANVLNFFTYAVAYSCIFRDVMIRVVLPPTNDYDMFGHSPGTYPDVYHPDRLPSIFNRIVGFFLKETGNDIARKRLIGATNDELELSSLTDSHMALHSPLLDHSQVAARLPVENRNPLKWYTYVNAALLSGVYEGLDAGPNCKRTVNNVPLNLIQSAFFSRHRPNFFKVTRL